MGKGQGGLLDEQRVEKSSKQRILTDQGLYEDKLSEGAVRTTGERTMARKEGNRSSQNREYFHAVAHTQRLRNDNGYRLITNTGFTKGSYGSSLYHQIFN